MSFIQRGTRLPLGYETPAFPSLYWPLPAHENAHASYLYHPHDIWRFTTLWTLLFIGAVHLVVACWACAIQWRSWKLIWITPVVYVVIGGLEALIAGSIVGGLLGAVYEAGVFKMSTWIPFIWGLLNLLVLILSSFSIHGGL